jgi:hypothetical protein
VLTHFEDEVVETLLVDSLKSLFELKSEFHQECEVRPAYPDGIIWLKQKRARQLSSSMFSIAFRSN